MATKQLHQLCSCIGDPWGYFSIECVVHENIHTFPMNSHGRFKGGGGGVSGEISKANFFFKEKPNKSITRISGGR